MRSISFKITASNRRAGYTITEHLLRSGVQRIGFLGVPGSAETIDDRIAGYREALYRHGSTVDSKSILRVEPDDESALGEAIHKRKIDALVCGNDLTAAKVMRTLLQMAVRIPHDVRVTGFDDVRYGELLPVPLTTIHQPCLEICAVAIAAMLDRISKPQLPPRSILLNGHLVVRKSCGASL